MTKTAEPAVEPVRTARVARLGAVSKVLPRALFAAVFVAVQLGLLLTSSRRPDGVFSFQMFNESSRMRIELYRAWRTRAGRERRAPVVDGRWKARDRTGQRRDFSWHDRVRDRTLGALGREVHAPYGLDAQLFRLRAALNDVARNIPDDRETIALIARVQTRKNGRDPVWIEYDVRRELE